MRLFLPRECLFVASLLSIAGCDSGAAPERPPESGTGLVEVEGTLEIAPSFRLPQDCATDEKPVWNAERSEWTCGIDSDSDSDTLAALSCSPGEVAKWDGVQWNCAADVDFDTLAALDCSAGQVPKWDGAKWLCAEVDTDTLASPLLRWRNRQMGRQCVDL